MIAAVVPAKDLRHVKGRLSSVLPQRERQVLFAAMLEDVLAALQGASSVALLVVVTREPELIKVAERMGAEPCIEPENLGHTEAVNVGCRAVLARGFDAMLTLPGDVPATTSAEIDAMAHALGPAPSAVLVPSRNKLGTNGVLLRPPDVMPLRFGEPSFSRHLATARTLGLEPAVLELAGIGLDVDTPEDLHWLARSGCGARTRKALSELDGTRELARGDGHAR